MSGSGDTLVLNQPLTGDITFSSGPAPITDVTIEPSALTYVSPSSSNIVQTELGGNVENFEPGDTIVLANLETDFASFASLAGLSSNDPTFNADIAAAASLGVQLYVEPNGSITTNNAFITAKYGAILNQDAGPYLHSLDQGLFGTNSLSETLTITPTFETSAHTTVDAVITTSHTINPCFATGTLIRTTRGDVPVEALAEGDTVVTASGGTRPVVWIGHRSLDFTRHPEPDLARPVRIAAGALGDGAPARDLVVSPDHALFLDGVLVQAKDLVDGVLITTEASCAEITYWHVELDSHDVLIAEGAAAESYLDSGHRGFFENGGEALDLHPDLMGMVREVHSCAPVIGGGARLTAIRTRLAARRAARGIAAAESLPAVRAGDERLVSEMNGGRLRVRVPAGCDVVELLADSFVPAEIDPASTDRRRLGLAIAAIALDGAPLAIETAIDAASLHPRAAGDASVWTRGAATIRLAPAAEERELDIVCAALPRVWTRPDPAAETARAA